MDIGIIGAGMITRNSHLPCALAAKGCRVMALADPAVESAQQLVHSYGINAKVAPRVDDIIGIVQAVIIATPNNTHREIAVKCLDKGVSTLIEKPLASSVKDGEAIVEAGQRSGAVVATGYSSRFRDNIVFLKELLDHNYFGKVKRFVHQFGTAGGWAPVSGYNLDRRATGGGVLVVTGTHFIDRLLYFWGVPDEVQLTDDSLGGPEANCEAEFWFNRNGAAFSGVVRYSKSTNLPGGLVIETERGVVRLKDTTSAEIVFRDRAAGNIEQVLRRVGRPVFDPAVSEFQYQIEDFIRAVQTKSAPMVDGEQGLMSLRLIERLYAKRRLFSENWYEQPAIEGTVWTK